LDELFAGADRAGQQCRDTGAVDPFKDEIGMFAQRRHRVGHRDADLCRLQERQVVLRVPSREHVVR